MVPVCIVNQVIYRVLIICYLWLITFITWDVVPMFWLVRYYKNIICQTIQQKWEKIFESLFNYEMRFDSWHDERSYCLDQCIRDAGVSFLFLWMFSLLLHPWFDHTSTKISSQTRTPVLFTLFFPPEIYPNNDMPNLLTHSQEILSLPPISQSFALISDYSNSFLCPWVSLIWIDSPAFTEFIRNLSFYACTLVITAAIRFDRNTICHSFHLR